MPFCVIRLCLCLVVSLAASATAAEIQVDCAVRAGTIRPLHGVGGGPLARGETIDLSAPWRELGIPIARLHDCEWPGGLVVDMHSVFPNSAADPQSPKNYRFGPTDDYISGVVKTGSKIVYRLGESIEHTQRKQFVHPPADYDRWAAACLGIIRHYNDGWADGFHHQIRYWEIWNEPENRPAMWSGTDEDYYLLYSTAAKTIKKQFPDLSVGGPAVGASGEVVDGRWKPSAFMDGLLAHCRLRGAPLDFFSWHTYTDDPHLYAVKAAAIRAWLDAAGFTKTEIHLNEWSYLPDNDWGPMLSSGQGEKRRLWYDRMGGAEGAAFLAVALAEMQDTPIDVANFYSGDTGEFGLFDRYGGPKKTYHAMRAFRRLLDTPLRVQAVGGIDGQLAACAGRSKSGQDSGSEVAVLISNFHSARDKRPPQESITLAIEHLPWTGETEWQVLRLDGTHDLQLDDEGVLPASTAKLELALPPPNVVLVKLRKAPIAR